MWPCYLGNKAVSLWWMFPFVGLWLWAVFTAYTALNMRWFLKSIEWKDPQPRSNAPFMLLLELRQSANQIGLFCTGREEGSSIISAEMRVFFMQQTCFYCRFIMEVLVQIHIQVHPGRVLCWLSTRPSHTPVHQSMRLFRNPTRSHVSLQEKHAV